MASQTEIANSALVKLGEQQVMSIDDNTKPARTMKNRFNFVRDAELRKRRWSFSIKRAQLAADATPPIFGFGSQYPMPTDCLRVLSISQFDLGPDLSDYHASAGKPFAIEGRKILFGSPVVPASIAPLPLRYIARIEDTQLWDATFVEAFACKLAMECCETLTQSSNKRQLAQSEYIMAIREATRSNAIELPSETISDDTWVAARLR